MTSSATATDPLTGSMMTDLPCSHWCPAVIELLAAGCAACR